MKSLSTIVLCIAAITMSMAQSSGVITYSETMKMNFTIDSEESGGIDLSEFLPESMSSQKLLTFSDKVSVYTAVSSDQENMELGNEDAGIKIVVMGDDIESVLYIDHSAKLSTEQKGFMGKTFVVEEAIEKMKWKITSEKVKYLDYECTKATRTNDDGKEVVAWFAPKISASVGPSAYGQLPGAILMLSEGDEDLVIKATNVEFKDVDELNKPTDGKKVTSEEYEKIVDEKTKEMMQERGGASFRIRN